MNAKPAYVHLVDVHLAGAAPEEYIINTGVLQFVLQALRVNLDCTRLPHTRDETGAICYAPDRAGAVAHCRVYIRRVKRATLSSHDQLRKRLQWKRTGEQYLHY